MLSYTLSTTLTTPIYIKIHHLTAPPTPTPPSTKFEQTDVFKTRSLVQRHSDLYITCTVYDGSHNALSVGVQTPYKAFGSKGRVWNSVLKLPICYHHVPIDAYLHFNVYEVVDTRPVLFASGGVSLFDRNTSVLRKGPQKVMLGKGDGEVGTSKELLAPLTEYEKCLFSYENGEVEKVGWLDDLREEEKIDESTDSFLFVELPQFELPVVYSEMEMASEIGETFFTPEPDQTTVILNSIDIPGRQWAEEDNGVDPVEMKYHKLERSTHNAAMVDRELKPSPQMRDELARILAKPASSELTDMDKNLVWKYRYYFSRNTSEPASSRSFLPKFLKSLNWDNEQEVRHVFSEMIPNYWGVERLQIGDALELLSAYFIPERLKLRDEPSEGTPDHARMQRYTSYKDIFRHVTFLRHLAVNRLRLASDEELELYLLQLVQALKYEALAYEKRPTDEAFRFVQELHDNEVIMSPLAKFLIERAVQCSRLGNFFYWYVKVENEDQLGAGTAPARLYTAVLNKYIDSLKRHCATQRLPHYTHLKRQTWFVKKLTHVVELLRSTFRKNEATARKREFLREYLANPANEMLRFPEPFPLPLDPSVVISGCVPEESSVFKSSLAPLKLVFKLHKSPQTYSLMFKIGDDLRQDQLVIQIINLMDQLLKNENLDLKLTPYRILATSPVAGLIQFVPNETLDTVLSSTYPTTDLNGILSYLKLHSSEAISEPAARSVLGSHTVSTPQSTVALSGVSSVLMDNYVKSCAGYCVITYLLGVGDRHLDNLLLSPNGKFWHADFGYILGRDPKPFPPLMKLPIQVVDGMGGMEHENFTVFKNYCFVAYTTLRRNSNLILNLFQLMSEANIPDIKIDPGRAVEKVEEKFCLGMTEEEAILHFQNLINDSVSAFLPVVIDRLHSLAQYWRA